MNIVEINGGFHNSLDVASRKNEFSEKGAPTETIILMQ